MKQETEVNRRTMVKTAGAGLGLILAGIHATDCEAAKKSSGDKPLRFHHVGIPTKKKHDNEKFLAGGKVYITDPEKHPFRIEWCRWMPDSESPELLKTTTHIAFQVDDVDAELAKYDKKDVFIEPFVPFEGVKVGFINHEGTLIRDKARLDRGPPGSMAAAWTPPDQPSRDLVETR